MSLDLSNLSNDGTMALLPPSALPKLRRLAIGRVAASAQDTVWATVVLYLPQLTSLSNQPLQAIMAAPGSARWTRAFGVVSHTLTHVELPCGLEPWIVTKLQQNAPGKQCCWRGKSHVLAYTAAVMFAARVSGAWGCVFVCVCVCVCT